MERKCASCNKSGVQLKKCSRCRLSFYCSQDCQAQNWETHRLSCKDQRQKSTNNTNASGSDVCAYCKKEGYNLKRCSKCRKVYYCSVECQTQAWPQHKLDCFRVNDDQRDDMDDLFRKCDYCGDLVFLSRVKYDCDGCSNTYCTKYCQANDWPKHKKACNLQTTPNQTRNDKFNKCAICLSDNDLKFCSRCHAVPYCSKSCQEADWTNHKTLCRDPENSKGDWIIENKIEIELKLREICSQNNKSFRQTMSPGPNAMGITFSEGDMSALFYEDFVDLRIYKKPKKGSWDKAVLFAKKTYTDYLVLFEMNNVPNEKATVDTKQLLVAYIPRYHHYRGRHCVYIEDVKKAELYIAFYFDKQLSRQFDWCEVRPGRFIIILNPKIHYFNDKSVGFRLEDPGSFRFLDI